MRGEEKKKTKEQTEEAENAKEERKGPDLHELCQALTLWADEEAVCLSKVWSIIIWHNDKSMPAFISVLTFFFFY